MLSLTSADTNGAYITLTSGSYMSYITQKNASTSDRALQFYNSSSTTGNNAFTFLNSSATTLLSINHVGDTTLASTTSSTSTTTGALIVGGGVGIGGAIWAATSVNANSAILRDTNSTYTYLALVNGTNSSYIFQNHQGTAYQGATAGATYIYMSNSQNFELNWADTTKFTFTSTGNLTTAGSGTFTGGGFNSLRSKKNILGEYTGNALDEISKFKIQDFYYKNEPTINRTLGFILDEIPESVQPYVWMGKDNDAVNLYSLHALSFKAHQETKSRVEILEDEVKMLKQKLERYELG